MSIQLLREVKVLGSTAADVVGGVAQVNHIIALAFVFLAVYTSHWWIALGVIPAEASFLALRRVSRFLDELVYLPYEHPEHRDPPE